MIKRRNTREIVSRHIRRANHKNVRIRRVTIKVCPYLAAAITGHVGDFQWNVRDARRGKRFCQRACRTIEPAAFGGARDNFNFTLRMPAGSFLNHVVLSR